MDKQTIHLSTPDETNDKGSKNKGRTRQNKKKTRTKINIKMKNPPINKWQQSYRKMRRDQ